MKSLRFTAPLLCALSFAGCLQLAAANLPGETATVSYNDLYSRAIEQYTAGGAANGPVTALSSRGQDVNDPYLDRQWPLARINLPPPEQFETAEPVLVAILDTGIDKDHADLEGRVAGEVNFSDSPTCDDFNGHGTFIAGIIAANADNGTGIAGIAPNARLLNVKVVNDDGSCRGPALVNGIIWAADHGARVINISIELNFGFSRLENAVNYAWKKGAVILAATSNSTIRPVYPARYENCIAVAATDKQDKDDFAFAYEDWVDLAAPGLVVYSTLPDDKYGFVSGTSFAVAHAGGLAALLYGIAGDSDTDGRLNEEIREALLNGTQPVNGSGIGLIDAGGSIESLQVLE